MTATTPGARPGTGAAIAQLEAGWSLDDIANSFGNKLRPFDAMAHVTLASQGAVSAGYLHASDLPMAPDVAYGMVELLDEWDAFREAVVALSLRADGVAVPPVVLDVLSRVVSPETFDPVQISEADAYTVRAFLTTHGRYPSQAA